MKRSTRLQRPGLLGGSTATTLLDADGPQPSLNLDLASGILDPRIDFQRTTVGTYYRGQFNQNLVTQSETFSTWTALAMTVANTTMPSPTGVGTAYGITEDGTTNQRALVQNVSTGLTPSQPATQTVYVKAGARNRVRLVQNAAGGLAEFLLTGNGSVLSNSAISASIDHVGNGWYRCRMTANCAASGTLYAHYINPQNAAGSNAYAGDGQIGIYVWGAQLTEGSLLTPYIPTTTAAITQGQIASSQPWNLVLRSQEFNVTWTAGNTTVTADATAAPNGTTTADKVIANTTNGEHAIYQGVAVVSGVTYTHSVFAKASEYTKMRMIPQATGTIAITEYDLSTGTSSLVSGTATHSITDVGNGWYRCSVTFTATGTGTGYIQINLVNASGLQSFAGDNTSGTFFWGAQVNQGTAALDYRSTTSSALWLPRFENDPVTGEARGLLIEGGATNLCLQSAAVRTSPWNVLQLTAAGSSITAPDGTASGTEVVINNGVTSGNGFIYQDITAAASTTYTASVYIKIKGTSQNTRIECDALNSAGTNIGTFGVTFTHSSETIGAVSAVGWTAQSGTLTNVGNGWYRVTITATSPATTAKIRWFMYSTSTGNGTDGRYFWGAQMEAQAFASSYIPTTTATVARGADSAVMTGTNFSSWYNQTEGTIYADQVVTSTGGGNQAAATLQQSLTQYLTIGQNSAGFGVSSSAFYIRDTTDQAVLNSSLTIALGSIIKSCGAYKVNDIAFSANGLATITDTSSTVPTPTELQLFNVGTVASSRSIRRIAYWPTRLPDATLQSLTT